MELRQTSTLRFLVVYSSSTAADGRSGLGVLSTLFQSSDDDAGRAQVITMEF
jgi:hypothetical protein